VAHLLGVASLVLEYGGNEDEAIAALLHDAVEDQGGKETRRLIAEKFGETVAQIVDGCTDADTLPKPPWRERKEAYIAHIARASSSVRLVSACDKLYNARTILADYRRVGDAIWERFKGGQKDGSLWYYQTLVTEFKKSGDHPVYDELDRTVKELLALVHAGG
jgi:GTP pyrophosphokinase